jgi:hypothetical protein
MKKKDRTQLTRFDFEAIGTTETVSVHRNRFGDLNEVGRVHDRHVRLVVAGVGPDVFTE